MYVCVVVENIPFDHLCSSCDQGCITEGSDADIVVWNGDATRVISAKTHHQVRISSMQPLCYLFLKCSHPPNVCLCVQAVDFNIFEGMEVHGVPEYVISQGRVVVEKGEVKVVRGSGRFIPRQPWSDFVYSRVFQRDKVTVLLCQYSLGHELLQISFANAGLNRSLYCCSADKADYLFVLCVGMPAQEGGT